MFCVPQRQKARVLTLIGILAQLEDSGPVGVIFTMMGAGKGNSCCLTWRELLSCVHLAIQLLVYGTYEFGHDADQSQLVKMDHIEL